VIFIRLYDFFFTRENRTFVRCFIFSTIIFSVMPKMKTVSGAKKRFSLTGTGKIKRKHAFHSHILTKKSNKRKRGLVKTGLIDVSNHKQVLAMIRS
jgi:large subunit ribosomal protein L35